MVEIDEGGEAARFRVDRVEQAGLILAEAQRVEPEAYIPGPDEEEETAQQAAFLAPAPLTPVFLDLPLLTGDEVEHAPHVAVHGNPWPGSAAIFKSSGGSFELAGLTEAPAVMGETLAPLNAADPGIFDRGPAVQVKLWSGALASVTEEALFNGANAAAIGDGTSDEWEIFQFQEATLVAEDTYELRLRLRGQSGTDAVMPATWPTGSVFVLLTSALVQPDLSAAERGLDRTWRIGPATQAVDDEVYVEETRAFEGIGLRPYAPVHLAEDSDGAGGHTVSWVRRTRVDGDSWAGLDVPLGEATEQYLVRVEQGGTVREETVTAPTWTYTAAAKSADGVAGAFSVDIAQISDRFGPGPFRRIDINA